MTKAEPRPVSAAGKRRTSKPRSNTSGRDVATPTDNTLAGRRNEDPPQGSRARARGEESKVKKSSPGRGRAPLVAHQAAAAPAQPARPPSRKLAAKESPASAEDPFTSKDWDVVRRAIPKPLSVVGLDEIDFPGRLVSYVRREGLRTVADLSARSKAELVSAKNLGRRSIVALVSALHAHIGRMAAVRRATKAGFFSSWRRILQEHDPVRRMVLSRRAGLGGEPETLRVIGAALRVTRERARQLERDALMDLARERFWLDEVKRRLDEALRDGAVALDDLDADPWWTGVAEVPAALKYFGNKVLNNRIHIIEINGRPYLTRCSSPVLQAAFKSLRRRAAKVPLPGPLSAFKALTEAFIPKVGRLLANVLFERLRELLQIEEVAGQPGSGARVLGFGHTSTAALLALLRASKSPVRIADLASHLARCQMPDEVLFFNRGLIGLESHLPNFRGWMKKVTPAAVAVLQREPPDRQWLASEILDELRKTLKLPAWLDDWHLAALLRRSGKLRYFGRNRFSLLEAPDERGRILYREELVRLLREHGAPMAREDLVAALCKKTTIPAGTITMYLAQPPFINCESDQVGLLDRDVPGGAAAVTKALDRLAGALKRRARGLAAAQVRAEVARLSKLHARWSVETCMSVLRSDPRFRVSRSSVVGLSSWESVRVPSRHEIVHQCLNESKGLVSVGSVQERVEAYYGEAPDRKAVGQMANRFGAVLRGDWLERAAGK